VRIYGVGYVHEISKIILALSVSFIFQSTTAFALDDGWYKAKSATGACPASMMKATVAVDQGAPISLSFISETFTFPKPVKPTKAAKLTKMTSTNEQFDVQISEPAKNQLKIKLINGECAQAEVIYNLAP